MDVDTAREAVLTATGRRSVHDALAWLIEGRALRRPCNIARLLHALAVLSEGGEDAVRIEADRGLKAVCRKEVASTLDPSTELLALDTVTPPDAYRTALADIAARTRSGDLTSVNLAAVAAAQAGNPNVMTTLCAVAGLSYRELRIRVPGLPSVPGATWQHKQIADAWAHLDALVSGRLRASSPAATPARPVEQLFPNAALNTNGSGASTTGWALVEHLRREGVPLELYLTQRAVGGAWLAHRNSTNNLLGAAVADALGDLLTKAGVPFTRVSRNAESRALLGKVSAAHADQATDGGSERPIADEHDDGAEAGQVSILVHTDDANFVHGVAISVAKDSGTASKSGARLAKMPVRIGIPCSVVLVGPGWSQRNETADLARAFEGRVYSDATMSDLAEWLRVTANVGGGLQTDHTLDQAGEQDEPADPTQES